MSFAVTVIDEELVEILNKVSGGAKNPLEAYVQLHQLEERIKDIKGKIQEAATEEAEKYGESTFQAYGKKITRKAAPGRYSYKHIPEWNSKKEELKSIETSAKSAYQQRQKGVTMTDDDGVIIMEAEYTPGKESISISKWEG